MKLSNWLLFLCLSIGTVLSLGKRERVPFFHPTTLSVWCSYRDGEGDNVLDDTIAPCPLPVPKLRSGRYEPAAAAMEYYTEPPPWLNVTLAKIGQTYFRTNFAGFLYTLAVSALLVAATSDVARILISAGNVTSPEAAGRRYIGNFLHYVFWFNGDFLDDLDAQANPNRWNQSSFFESINLIRTVHDKVAQQAHQHRKLFESPTISRKLDKVPLNDKLWEALAQDLEASHLVKYKNRPVFPPNTGGTEYYFNQFVMSLQYWTFVALPVINPRKAMFLPGSDEEVKGYLHFWAFLAHTMGLKPEYNVVLQPDLKRANIYFRKMLEEYFIPILFHVGYEEKVVLEVSIKGFAQVFPFIDDTIAFKQLCEDVLGITPHNVLKILSPQARFYSRVLDSFRSTAHRPRANAIARFFINGLVHVGGIKQFGFNMMQPSNFTKGLLAYDEDVLKAVNLWSWRNKANVWVN